MSSGARIGPVVTRAEASQDRMGAHFLVAAMPTSPTTPDPINCIVVLAGTRVLKISTRFDINRIVNIC
jgi:hypothetical protein